jgi:hypothetical protein
LELSGIKPNTFEPLEKGPDDPCWESHVQVGTKVVDGKSVPNCVPMDAQKVKEGFPIPSPSGDESESDFIGRCNSDLYDEFPDDAQRNAVCYKSWRGE